MPIPALAIRASLCALVVCSPTLGNAQSAAPGSVGPLWEVGVGGVAVRGPDYPAAQTGRLRAVGLPFVIYRGQRLRVDEEGVRGRLLNTGRFEVDVSAAAAFNARSNSKREGMPALDYTFELGPQILYRVPLGGGQVFSTHLKARSVISTNRRRLDDRGVVIEPEVRWGVRGWPDARSFLLLSAKAMWASEALQDYFYQVDPVYAAPGRPAFDARAGYLGSALRLGLAHRLNPSTSVSLGTTISFHGGAANQNSPLFQRSTTASVILALQWTAWRSGQQAGP